VRSCEIAPYYYDWIPDFAEAGALMSYGPNYFDSYKAAAPYVDKILKGDNPADLPIDQSSRFEFVVNNEDGKDARYRNLNVRPRVRQ
jgi:hypothetical protein